MLMTFTRIALLSTCLLAAFAAPAEPEASTVTIASSDPRIYYTGRWDSTPGSWWAGTGFKINVQGLTSLQLTLGSHTSSVVSLGVSLDYGTFVTVNVTAGTATIPLSSLPAKTPQENTVVRINSWGWQNNRLNLESIILNSGATLLNYNPASFTFQFIGDSLSAGQYLPQGVDQAWPFLTAEAFKAEHVVTAQPGITLTDMVSYGNQHGMIVQFFDTEDPGYYYDYDHNYTTPWSFSRDVPAPNVVVIHIGANDNGQGVSASTFVENYTNFLAHLRTIYVTQKILMFTPWGWPQPNGSVGYYYQGSYQQIYNARRALGDNNIFLVDTTGWVSYQDIFPSNSHPTVAGHQKIAGLFETWLRNNGIQPEANWNTLPS